MRDLIRIVGLVVGLLSGLASGVTQGGPPPGDRPAEAVSVAPLRQQMEGDLAEIGEYAAEAREDGDLQRMACIRDVQKRAQGVMEVATGELLVLRDASTTPEARAFAAEKFRAAAERLHQLVERARECAGDAEAEDEDDATRNKADQPSTVPLEDPTEAALDPLPPPVDDTRPPVVASPSA